jgi:hypothetical protein
MDINGSDCDSQLRYHLAPLAEHLSGVVLLGLLARVVIGVWVRMPVARDEPPSRLTTAYSVLPRLASWVSRIFGRTGLKYPR